MKTITEIKGYISNHKFSCIKCHKLIYQIFRITIGINKRNVSTWLCLDCFNEIFKYFKK